MKVIKPGKVGQRKSVIREVAREVVAIGGGTPYDLLNADTQSIYDDEVEYG